MPDPTTGLDDGMLMSSGLTPSTGHQHSSRESKNMEVSKIAAHIRFSKDIGGSWKSLRAGEVCQPTSTY